MPRSFSPPTPAEVKRALPYLAPYLAVFVFWLIFKSAWLTLLAYHAQMLFWSRHRLGELLRGWDARWFAVAVIPCALAGPVVSELLPTMTGGGGVAAWLTRHGLVGDSLVVMIPYFGIVHPLLEQAHWSGLRTRGWRMHLAFAGYHAIVLATLLHPLWLVLCIAVLVGTSAAWTVVQKRTSGLMIPALGHVLADLGIVVAAWVAAPTWFHDHG